MADRPDPRNPPGPIVSDGPASRGWTWLRRLMRGEQAPEVTLGSPAPPIAQPVRDDAPPPAEAADPDLAELDRLASAHAAAAPEARPSPPAPPPPASGPLTWKTVVIAPAIAAFTLFHLAPSIADLFGEPRTVLAAVFGPLPFGDTLARGASAWLWEPTWVWAAALILRLRALQQLRRSPPNAVMMALVAAAWETGFWLFMGLKQGGFSPAEQADLILLLKIEGGALLALFFLFAPTGKRRLGETDAHWNRG